MNELPLEIKFSIILAIILMITVVILLIAIIVLFNRRQILFQKEKKLKESEYHNQLLQNEIDYQKKVQLEQERISQDMHDDIGAGISAIKLQAEFLKKQSDNEILQNNIDDMLRTCEEVNLSMREMLWNLKSGNDSILNFAEHIVTYTQVFFGKTNLKINILTNGIGEENINAETRRNLFLCVKESLNNIYKHSNAENAEVQLTQTNKKFTILIKDDGVGMKTDAKYGNGLGNMKWRMSSIGGEFEIIPVKKGFHIKFDLNL